jgi:hypothetical protein
MKNAPRKRGVFLWPDKKGGLAAALISLGDTRESGPVLVYNLLLAEAREAVLLAYFLEGGAGGVYVFPLVAGGELDADAGLALGGGAVAPLRGIALKVLGRRNLVPRIIKTTVFYYIIN